MVRRMAQSVPADHRPRVDAKPARRLPPTDPFNLNRVANLSIQLHELHPQPSAFTAESFLLLEFYSGAAGPPGRFSEGFLLRRLHLPKESGMISKEPASLSTVCSRGD